MSEANITIEDLTGSSKTIKIVHVSGQLDESNIDEKVKDIYKLIEGNPKGINLLFEMSKLEYMNSKSIGYLTDLYGKIAELGGQVVIAGAPSNIVDILQVVGLTQLIKSFSTVEEAKSYLNGGVGETESTVKATPAAVETPVIDATPTPEVAPTTTTPTAIESVAAPAPVTAPTPEPTPATEPAPTLAVPVTAAVETTAEAPAKPAEELKVEPKAMETEQIKSPAMPVVAQPTEAPGTSQQ